VGAQDKAGRITGYTNDALRRLVFTVYPDNSGTTNFYDAVGRVFAMSDARGKTKFYGYDAAGRRTSMTNALGQVIRSVFNESGNLVQVIDALGRTNTFVFDELNRRRTVLFPDGTDQSFNTTLFGYDALGRLIAVTNALTNVTLCTYDEQGQQTAQTDAEFLGFAC
jgi:YD repeat-containing protein